jgi:peptide/nickel transport system ATP-binding protein
MTSSELLDVKGLSLSIGGKPFLHKLSFTLSPSKILALVGESGSGKSLTALTLMRLLDPPFFKVTAGQLLYKGQDLLGLSERQMRKLRGGEIGMIFQDPASSLNPVYRIGEQLMEAALTHLNVDMEQSYVKSVEALKSVGMPDPMERMEDYPHQLSGGMKQRAMIAMALIGRPALLIADEPTTALDVTIQMQILELMRHLKSKQGLSILLITHDMGVVAELADEVAVMYAGEIVEKGLASEIFHHPSHPYTQGLFESLDREQDAEGHFKMIKGRVPSLNQIPQGCKFHPRCPYAFDRCRQGEVSSFVVSATHQSKCWLLDGKFPAA